MLVRSLLALVATCVAFCNPLLGAQSNDARAAGSRPTVPVLQPHTVVDVPPPPRMQTAIHITAPPGVRNRTSRSCDQLCQEPVTYHGGPVISHDTTYAIFWLPSGQHFEPTAANDAAYEALINRYFQDIGSSTFYNLVTQYYDNATGYPLNSSQFGGSSLDTTPYPHAGTAADPLQDQNYKDAVTRAMLANGWTSGVNHYFFVFTAYNIESCTSALNCSEKQYCGYHSAFNDANGQTVVYANMPTLESCVSYLKTQGSPNKDYIADGVINTLSHEHIEGTADPVPNSGWIDLADTGTGGEIGDKCAYTFGPLNADGSNITLNSHPYILQQEYSNATKSCVLTYASTPPPALATYYVAPSGLDSNDCLSVATPCKTIGGALLKLPRPGDTVQVAAGTYNEHLTLTTNVTLSGAGASQTIVDGGNNGAVVTIPAGGTDTVTGLTIQHGSAPATSGNLGGGILNNGNLTLNQSAVTANTAQFGGGIGNYNASATIIASTISGNGATVAGGGIYNNGSTLTVTNSTFSGNTASSGGQAIGGAIAANDLTVPAVQSNVKLFNATVSGNTADFAGGIANFGATAVSIQNTILAANTGTTSEPDCQAIFNSGGYNVVGVGGDAANCPGLTNGVNGDQVGTAVTVLNPMLGALANNGGPTLTMAPQTGSPAIDMGTMGNMGNPAGCTDAMGQPLLVDQRGAPRPSPSGGRCDVGAVEVQQGGTTSTWHLTPGFNLITLPLQPATAFDAKTFLGALLTQSTGQLDALFQLNNGIWGAPLIDNNGTFSGSTFSLQLGTGYLFYSDKAVDYQVAGTVPATPPTWQLTRGWNLVGLPTRTGALPTSHDVLSALLTKTGGTLAALFGLTGGSWNPSQIDSAATFIPNAPFTVKAGVGYLLYSDTATASFVPGVAGRALTVLPGRRGAGSLSIPALPRLSIPAAQS